MFKHKLSEEKLLSGVGGKVENVSERGEGGDEGGVSRGLSVVCGTQK